MHAPMPAPRRRSRTRGGVAGLLLVLVAATARGADDATPTPASRVAYWLDRLLTGPEAATWKIRDFHQNVLLDAERNLVALGSATLDRLADPALQRRVQESRDANPWHAILNVLRVIGVTRPEVARAWATPALRNELRTLRRTALPVLLPLRDAVDGPVLVEVLRRDLTDRVLGPLSVEALLGLGAPWDAIAVRELYERATTDQPYGASALWSAWPSVAAAAGGRPPRDDLLAWWALLAESSGPLVSAVDPSTGERAGAPSHARAAAPLSHAVPQGRGVAAAARALLATAGRAPAKASVAEDLRSGDEVLVRAARTGDPAAARALALASGAATLDALKGGQPVAPPAALAQLRALADDPSAAATALLSGFLASLPSGPEWRAPLAAAYGALAARGKEDSAYLERHLRSGTPMGVDLALFLARSAKSLGALEVLDRWHEAPESASSRLRLRREIAFLYGLHAERGGLTPGRLEAFAQRLRAWADDPADRSGPALAGMLPDLGAAGDRALAAGLRSPRRSAYLPAVRRGRGRYLGPDVAAALLEPVGRDTPVAERRQALEAVLTAAGSDALASLDALASRLPPEDRADVDVVRGIVRWRIPSTTGD
jgi:hypothetical protein